MAPRRKRKPADEPRKLSVFADPKLLRRVRQEKVDTGCSIGEIVNARLARSYEESPELMASASA